MDIINTSIAYYDSNQEKYKKIKKKIRFVKQRKSEKTKLENLNLVFYDEHMNELFESRVEIIGKYYNTLNTWIWGWALSGINKYLTNTIRKVFLYGTDIDLNNDNANIVLRNELITSRFKIDDIVQLEIHCALSSYLSKNPFIFGWKEINFKPNETTEIKGEYDDFETDVTYYTFILDPPNV